MDGMGLAQCGLEVGIHDSSSGRGMPTPVPPGPRHDPPWPDSVSLVSEVRHSPAFSIRVTASKSEIAIA